MADKRAIKVETLDRLAEGFQESRGITDKLTMKQMIAFAKEPVGGGENKFAQLFTKQLTELTSEDTAGTNNVNYYFCAYQKQLTNVELNEGITFVYNYAFSLCSKLTSFKGVGITQIYDYCFNKCSVLPSITLPNIEGIYGYAFTRCSNLKTVRLGQNISLIASTAFDNCPNLTDIYIDKPEGSISGTPWGAPSATVHWNTPLPSEEA